MEDIADVRAQLCGFAEQYAGESGMPLQVQAFENGVALLPYRGGFDLVFMDIEMPRQGGLVTAERIREVDQEVVLIFVTNMAQDAIREYEVDALDFVLKPVNYYQFKVKLERAIRRIKRRGNAQISMQSGGTLRLLHTHDIYYLETHNRMLYYHTAGGVLPVRASMLSAQKQLEPSYFARCNQCYLVNLRHVESVQDDFVLMGGDKLEISRRQRTDLPGGDDPFVTGMNWAVIILFCVIPMVAWAAPLIARKGYTLTGDKMKEIQMVNACRHDAIAGGMSLEEAMQKWTTIDQLPEQYRA